MCCVASCMSGKKAAIQYTEKVADKIREWTTTKAKERLCSAGCHSRGMRLLQACAGLREPVKQVAHLLLCSASSAVLG